MTIYQVPGIALEGVGCYYLGKAIYGDESLAERRKKLKFAIISKLNLQDIILILSKINLKLELKDKIKILTSPNKEKKFKKIINSKLTFDDRMKILSFLNSKLSFQDKASMASEFIFGGTFTEERKKEALIGIVSVVSGMIFNYLSTGFNTALPKPLHTPTPLKQLPSPFFGVPKPIAVENPLIRTERSLIPPDLLQGGILLHSLNLLPVQKREVVEIKPNSTHFKPPKRAAKLEPFLHLPPLVDCSDIQGKVKEIIALNKEIDRLTSERDNYIKINPFEFAQLGPPRTLLKLYNESGFEGITGMILGIKSKGCKHENQKKNMKVILNLLNLPSNLNEVPGDLKITQASISRMLKTLIYDFERKKRQLEKAQSKLSLLKEKLQKSRCVLKCDSKSLDFFIPPPQLTCPKDY